MHALTRFYFALFLVTGLITINGCGTPQSPEETPTPIIQVQTVEVPVTVVSTRIVEVPILVTPTPSKATACRAEQLENSQEVLLGALVPLTGRSAIGGMSMQAGINIAVDKLNSEGGIQGKPIRLVTYDTGGTAAQGSERAIQLITRDCVVGIIGIYDSEVGLAVKDIIHQFNIPTIFVDTYNDDITADQLPEVFRIAPSMTMFAEMTALWMKQVGDYNGDGQTFVVIVAENSPYGEIQTNATVHWLEENQIAHTELLVDLPTTDFSSVIARIVDLDVNPDTILIRLYEENGLELHRQLLKNGISHDQKTLIVDGQAALDDKLFWSLMGEDGTSTIALRIGPWYNTVNEEGKQFAERYRAYKDQWPTYAAFSGYDAVRLMSDAIQRSPTLRGDDLISALESTSMTLTAGTYYFPYTKQNPLPDNERRYLWHQWLDVPLLYLQYTEQDQPSSQMAVIWPEVYRTVDGPLAKP